MKKLCFLLILLIHSYVLVHGQTSSTEVNHIGAGFIVGGIGGYAAYKVFDGNRYWTWAGAVGSSLGAGLAKEIRNDIIGRPAEVNDVVNTVIGGAISALVLDLILHKNDRRRGGKSRGRYRRGKNCGCLVIDVDTEKYNQVPIIFTESGSRDIASAIQAHGIYNSTY